MADARGGGVDKYDSQYPRGFATAASGFESWENAALVGKLGESLTSPPRVGVEGEGRDEMSVAAGELTFCVFVLLLPQPNKVPNGEVWPLGDLGSGLLSFGSAGAERSGRVGESGSISASSFWLPTDVSTFCNLRCGGVGFGANMGDCAKGSVVSAESAASTAAA